MSKSLKPKKMPELPALTGIRFVAASLVFMSHVPRLPGMEWLLAYWPFNLGTFGVAVFFVLSGFILTYNYAGVFESGVSLANCGHFIWDRLSKVYPLYFFTLLLCIPIQLAGGHRDWSWNALWLHLTLAQSIYPGQQLKLTDYFNVPGWSISCEMLFYILAPPLIWLALRWKQWQQLVVAAVVLWPLSLFVIGKPSAHLLWPGRFAPLRVPEFCLGIMMAAYFIRFQLIARRAWIYVSAGLALITVAIGCDAFVPSYLANGPLAGPGAALLIYGLSNGEGLLARWLSHRWIVLLGASSYSFYLIHDPVIRICRGFAQHYQLNITGPWRALVVGTVLFIVLQALSICVFKQIELPIQKRLRSLMFKKAPTNPPPVSVESSCGQPPV